MNFVIILCLVAMIAFVVITLYQIVKKKGIDRIKYIRDFKKGNFLRIYVVSIPLFWIGIYYSGSYSVGASFLLSLKDAVDSITLKFEYDAISKLIEENALYRFTMWLYFALAIINAVFFAFTIFWQKINNYIKRAIAFRKSEINIIVGLNEETKMLINSLLGDNVIVIIFSKSQEDIDYLTIKKVSYMICGIESTVNKLEKIIKNIKEKEINIIVDTNSDVDNLLLTKQLCEYICKEELYTTQKEIKRGFNAYVVYNSINESAFSKFVYDAKGCIHTINKHLLIGMSFVDKYPLTKFLDMEHIDYESATIKSEVELNVAMIGFGKVNQQVFLAMVSNNQFLSIQDGKIAPKPVNYFVFDKKESQNDKNLNHNYFRYKNEILEPIMLNKELKEEYFELPSMPANFSFKKNDINDIEFYTSIKECLIPKNGKCPYNYVVVSFGEDLENIDMAKKIQVKLDEWGLSSYTKLFVRIKNYKLIESGVLTETDFYSFGSDAEVFSKDVIIDSSLELLARLRDKSYIETKSNEKGYSEKSKKSFIDNWYEYHPIKRKSNIYAGISIRSKLHLLGLDYKEEKVKESLSEHDYMRTYAIGDMPIYEIIESEKKKVIYPLNFQSSKRHNFAIMEHIRWNAFMISEGFVPAKKKQCFDTKFGFGKSYEIRFHRNLTTFEGLYDYRRFMAERELQNNKYADMISAEKGEDVIKYDYQIMDDLYWFFDKINYSIVYKDHSATLNCEKAEHDN